MRSRSFVAILLFVLALGVAVGRTMPDEGMGTPAAKAEFEKGEAARKTGDFKIAADHFRKAIEIDPDFVEAHQSYVFLEPMGTVREIMKQWDESHPAQTSADGQQAEKTKSERDTRESEAYTEVRNSLEAQYQEWSKEHPAKAVYRWVLGTFNEYKDPHLAEKYYREALKIDPRFARAYNSLSLIDEVRGDLDASREDLRKAVEANPKDAGYLFYYAQKFRAINSSEYTRLSMQVVEKFPETERAPQALYWLAHSTPTTEAKIRYLEMLRQKFPPEKSGWSSNGMTMLFGIYDKTDPPRALALAREMIKANPKDRTWPQLANYAQAMTEAEQLLAQGKSTEAATMLDKASLPRYMDQRRLELFKARSVDATGDTSKAYGNLIKTFASTPTDEVRAALTDYGKKLGKNSQQIENAVWAIRNANARAATPFSLMNYSTRKPMSLADFQGRVFLLNFWYPQCGPCRGEFPYIQAVLDKYKSQGFEIVAVNVHPPEDDFVLPLLKGFKLGFIPLKSDDKWAAEAYKVRGEPTNFLIGSDSRIYFGPISPVSSPEAQRTLELQVEALLLQAKSMNQGKPSPVVGR